MPTPNYTPQDIAQWFLCNIDREAGDSITHLKLQKLVYYAQAWSLAIFDQALFDEDFEAWVHGPALWSLYQAYNRYGWDAIPHPRKCPQLDRQTQELMNDILEIYGQLTAKNLEELTHLEAPWRTARRGLPPDARSNNVIDKQLMKNFYAELYRKNQDSAQTHTS